MKRTDNTRLLGIVGFCCSLYGLSASGCGDADEERLLAAKLAEGCTLHSHCEKGLVCIFSRCHEQCREDFDCTLPRQRCVRGDDEYNVCQLPDDANCEKHDDCRGEQRCAEDGRCRDECSDEDQCVGEQQCTETGACVSEDKDVLTADGELPAAQAGGSGGSAASGAGGSGGRGGSSARGGDGGSDTPEAGDGGGSGAPGGGHGGSSGSGDDEEGGDGGQPSTSGSSGSGGTLATSGAGGMSGSAGSAIGAGTSAGGRGGEGGTGSPPTTESEPNDTRDEPDPLPLGSELYGTIETADDLDFYEFVTPQGSAAGGYFQYAITDVGPSVVGVRLYSRTNDNLVFSHEAESSGGSVFGHFAGSPGARYQLVVSRWVGGQSVAFDYTLRLDYTAVPDAHEPNDVRANASTVELGAAITGYLFAGLKSSEPSGADFEDWYAFEAAAGDVNVAFSAVPQNVRIAARVYDPNGATVGAEGVSSTAGATLSFARPLAAPGTHYVRVAYNSPMPQSYGAVLSAGEVPQHYTQPYVLTLTQ